jgi:beta-glucosidase
MSAEDQSYGFPPGFFWGCSTSAHQIEGGLVNDWSEWEKSDARLAGLRDKSLDPQDFISGNAANSYADANADLACMAQLNLNAYRFSVDWSRIEPAEGRFDENALDYYLDFVKKLRGRRIEPFVTLWHWPVPLWLRDKGGWESPEAPKFFERFVKRAVEHLNAEVNFWITLNEPLVYGTMSFLKGEWPPCKKSWLSYCRVENHLAAGHRLAYDAIKALDGNNRVGIAKHNIFYEPYRSRLANRWLAAGADWWWNRRFLDRIKDKQDFIGLNYYFHNKVDWGFGRSHVYERYSDMKWGLHPEGVYHLLKGLARYRLPIYITENGLADRGDQHRSWYIAEILKNTHRAISEGVPVKGYFHWSLIDNFEWAHGFDPRFGLFEVDYLTFERKARSSAAFYADICKNNRI